MEWTDKEAAERATRGDQHAFRILVERHSHAIFRVAFRISGNETDSEDLVQETFLRAYRQLRQFDGRSSFKTWLYRICINCSLDLIRSRRSRREVQPPEWFEELGARSPSPERLSQSRQVAEMLRPAMDLLTETERSAFLLRHYEGLDINQIADVLCVQAGAAKHSIFRAVRKLRRALQPVREVETK